MYISTFFKVYNVLLLTNGDKNIIIYVTNKTNLIINYAQVNKQNILSNHGGIYL